MKSEGVKKLKDSFGREISYVRIAVTDRCNLRCFYCMPSEGINFVPRKELLTFEELERMVSILGTLGVNKVRITGGEPFVRKGTMEFIERLSSDPGVDKISVTTNGTFTSDYIDRLKASGVKSINLSLDSVDKSRFEEITRRDVFEQVMTTFDLLVKNDFEVKINMVVMDGRNIEDIYPMLNLAQYLPVSVRFIEEMPFNGTPGQGNPTLWPMPKILDYIKVKHPEIIKLNDPKGSTSYNYQIPEYVGTFGIIAAYTRTFCGNCNRIRLTPQGELINCLYSGSGTSFRDVLRSGSTDEEIAQMIRVTVGDKPKDGFEAEKMGKGAHQSMATIGG